jgi:Fic family protein
MRKELFTSESPGKLVAVQTHWGNDHSFLPDPLPPNWEFPAQLWPKLSKAREQLSLLEGLGRTLPNPNILLRPLVDRESIRSSRLEGTYASPRELLLFEIEPKQSVSEEDPVNSFREVYNYRQAIIYGTNSKLPLSLRFIKELHSTLLNDVRGKNKAPGSFRNIQVGIGDDGRFIPPPASAVLEALDNLEKYFHAPNPFDPLVDAFLCHYQFETIHPFLDGNGRVGRLLLTIMLQKSCGMSKPWLYISEYFERHKDDYISLLFNVSAKGNWTEWIEFCLDGTIQQAIETVSRCERLRTIRETYMKRTYEIQGTTRLSQIVEGIFDSPLVRISDLTKVLKVSYPTAKGDVDRLVEAGLLKEFEGVYPKTFYAPEIFSIAYEKLEIGE